METIFSPDGLASTGAGPLYLQLQRRIREAVTLGRLKPHDSLPPEREMAVMTGLSRVTVRKAVEGLVAQGTLVQRGISSGSLPPCRTEGRGASRTNHVMCPCSIFLSLPNFNFFRMCPRPQRAGCA